MNTNTQFQLLLEEIYNSCPLALVCCEMIQTYLTKSSFPTTISSRPFIEKPPVFDPTTYKIDEEHSYNIVYTEKPIDQGSFFPKHYVSIVDTRTQKTIYEFEQYGVVRGYARGRGMFHIGDTPHIWLSLGVHGNQYQSQLVIINMTTFQCHHLQFPPRTTYIQRFELSPDCKFAFVESCHYMCSGDEGHFIILDSNDKFKFQTLEDDGEIWTDYESKMRWLNNTDFEIIGYDDLCPACGNDEMRHFGANCQLEQIQVIKQHVVYRYNPDINQFTKVRLEFPNVEFIL